MDIKETVHMNYNDLVYFACKDGLIRVTQFSVKGVHVLIQGNVSTSMISYCYDLMTYISN